MDEKYISNRFLDAVSNLTNACNSSKLSMFSTKNKCVKVVYENINEGAVYALEIRGNYFATHRGANLCVYKKKAQIIVELCTTRLDFILAISNNKIACACPLGSFYLIRETNHLSLDALFTQ